MNPARSPAPKMRCGHGMSVSERLTMKKMAGRASPTASIRGSSS